MSGVPAIRPATATFIALVAAHSLVDCFGGVFPIFKYRAGLDLEVAGMLATITLFIGAGLQPLIGLLADHGHERRFVIWGAALSALGIAFGSVGMLLQKTDAQGVVYFTAGGYAVLFVLQLIVRIGQALFHPPGVSLAGNLNHARRATMVSAFVAVGMFGFAFSQGFFSLLYDWTGGQTHWMLIPAALIVLAAIVWCRPTHAAAHRRIEWKQVGSALHAVRGPLFALFLIQALMAALNVGIIFLMPEFVESCGYPQWMSRGVAFMVFVLGSVAIMVPVGALADRIGRTKVMLGLLVLSVVTYYAWLWVPTLLDGADTGAPGAASMVVFCILCALMGAATNTTNPVGVTLGQHLSPKHANVISGVLMGLAWAAGSWGQWIVSRLAVQPELGPRGALAILGTVMLPCVALATRLPREKGREASVESHPSVNASATVEELAMAGDAEMRK